MQLSRWKLSLLALVLTFSSFAAAQKIKTDFDSAHNLANLKSFSFAPISTTDALASHPDLAQKIKTDLRTQLEKIGMREDDYRPDFLVFISANRQDNTSTYTATNTGWASGNQVWTTTYMQGTLVTDFLDPSTKQAFWRGVATETAYAGNNLQKYIPKGVQKLVEAFRKDIDKQQKAAKQ